MNKKYPIEYTLKCPICRFVFKAVLKESLDLADCPNCGADVGQEDRVEN